MPPDRWQRLERRNLQDFHTRLARAAPNCVLESARWTAILVHPPADDPILREWDDVSSEQGLWVDAYVRIGGLVLFVAASAAAVAVPDAGLYYWFDTRVKLDKAWQIIEVAVVVTADLVQTYDQLADCLEMADRCSLRLAHPAPWRWPPGT